MAVTAAAFAFGAAPGQAQSQTWAIGLTGGASVYHGDLTPSTATSADETVFETGWIAGLQLERWLGSGRFGIRLNTVYTQRALERDPDFTYTVFFGDLDVLFRPLPANQLGIAPFVVVGGGATMYSADAAPEPLGGGAFGDDPVVKPHALVGLGVDFEAARLLGFRLEVSDQIVLPSIGESPESSGLPNTHNAMVLAGIQLLLGQPGPAGGRAARPPAAPEPEARPRPEPEPEPAEPEPTPEPQPSPEPQPEAEPTPAPEPAAAIEETLYTVQLDAYMVEGTADRWVQRLEGIGLPAWRVDSELGGTPVSVVRAGAVPSEADAQALARLIEERFGRATRIDTIGPDEPVPTSAVVRSLRVLGGQ